MELSKWIELFARAVTSPSSLFSSSSNQNVPSNGTGLPNAREIAAGAISTSMNVTGLLRVERNPALTTIDGTFGVLSYNGELICETVENKGAEIPEGLYDAVIDISPRLGYPCPHIRVPPRDEAAGGDAGIRIHVLNEPSQSEGCIGTGTKKDGDAEDFSQQAFDKMMAVLPPMDIPFKVLIESIH